MRRWLVAVLCIVALAVVPGCKKKKKHGKDKGKVEDPVEVKRRSVKEYVEVTAGKNGFSPDHMYANSGEPITLTFTRDTDSTCITAVVFASENRREDLPVDKPVKVTILPGKPGRIHFACPQNKFGGDIEVQ